MKKALRIGIFSAICVALLVGYYYYLTNRNASISAEQNTEVSEVSDIIAKDFDNNYPATPRAVIKWYNRIITAYYGQSYNDAEFNGLVSQARCLLDDELLANNPLDKYTADLSAEIEDYHNRNKTIVSSSVSETNEVKYATVNGDDVAYVTAYYFAREGSSYTRTYQQYVLRKNDKGQWKILAFRLVDGEDYE